MHHHGVTFNLYVTFGSTRVCSPAMLDTSFSNGKDIWIAANDYYMYF